MAGPLPEYSRIDPWTMTTGPGSVSMAMAGPTGIKRMVTLFISGIGIGGPTHTSQLSNVRFTSAALWTIACTWIGRIVNGLQFVEVYRAAGVPIGGADTTYLEFSWSGTCSGPCPVGNVESAYWDTTSGFLSARINQGLGTLAEEEFFALGDRTTYYGVIMGSTISDWRLAGTPTMQTIYPEHGTVPAQFTNSKTVLVGTLTQSGPPKFCCGFLQGPTPTNGFFGFSFAATTAWHVYILTISSPPPVPQVAIPSRLATIVG